jgi:hypothetical protein
MPPPKSALHGEEAVARRLTQIQLQQQQERSGGGSSDGADGGSEPPLPPPRHGLTQPNVSQATPAAAAAAAAVVGMQGGGAGGGGSANSQFWAEANKAAIRVVRVACGANHTVAVTDTGKVREQRIAINGYVLHTPAVHSTCSASHLPIPPICQVHLQCIHLPPTSHHPSPTSHDHLPTGVRMGMS